MENKPKKIPYYNFPMSKMPIDPVKIFSPRQASFS